MNEVNHSITNSKKSESLMSNSPENGDTVSSTSGYIAGSAQALGHRYEHNEDSLLAFSAVVESHGLKSKFGLFCVADGMGGYENGELASELAVQKMADQVIRKIYVPLINPEERHSHDPILEVLEDAMMLIHKEINQKIEGGGTTLTTVLLMGDSLTIAHVGDTRAYCINTDGEIWKVTEDQTLVQRLITMGQMTEEEARIYPQRNVLYYALGRGDNVEPFLSTRKQPQNAYLMLCSDGLWESLDEKEMVKIVLEQLQPENISIELVKLAIKKGAMDNVTVLTVKL